MEYTGKVCEAPEPKMSSGRTTIKDMCDRINDALYEVNNVLSDIVIVLTGEPPKVREKQDENCLMQTLDVELVRAKGALDTALMIRNIILS